jgi:tetratricopeptide (TPR) repeat protein/tRNA A-37 threonylcarbamoyl transferase component Bud32
MSDEQTKGRPPDPEEEIFEACLARPIEERAGYLDRVCVGDAALRHRVEELLRSHSLAESFLEEPPVSVGAGQTIKLDVPLAEKVGDRIGRYKLLQQIGEGGCGVVYMAEQEEPVKRRVALKVIKLGMDTKNVIARFEAERQALAMMDHPNIAKVLDAGATDKGRPYFVMELVRGVKITDYCDKNNLPTCERLLLFVQVCQAIQHAHQKGIIHRDIKPSNILVTLRDGGPVPKVIDFGIAKATTDQRLTDKTLFTAFEQFIGTPTYMSPEQAEMSELGIDTRSDIYSLGVLLYELLTGQTPFDSKVLLQAGLDEIRRIIREQEPVRPSTRLSTMLAGELTTTAQHRQAEPAKLRGLIRGDLDWIVMKCLEKDRARRYETANGLAADVQRHLNNEPVVACPPGNVYKFQKLVRRNKLAFFAASAVAAALIIGLGVATLMFFNEQQARRQAEAERRNAETEAAKSEQVAQFLKEMLQGVGPSVAQGRDTTMLRDILDQTLKRMGEELTNRTDVQVQMLNTIGRVYWDLGQFRQAERLGRQALAVERGSTGHDEDMAISMGLVGLALEEEGNLDEASAIFREELAMHRKLHGDADPQTANSLNEFGYVLEMRGKLEDAEKYTSEGLAIRQKSFGENSQLTAESLRQLGLIRRLQGKLAESESVLRRQLAIMRNEGDPVSLAFSLTTLAETLSEESKHPEAETLLREGLAIQRKVYGNENPHVFETLVNLAATLNKQRKQRKLAEVETVLREVLNMQGKLEGDTRRVSSQHLMNWLAGVLSDENKLAEGEAVYREALPACTNGDPEIVLLLDGLTDNLLLQKKPTEAEKVLRYEATQQRQLAGNQDYTVGMILLKLAKVLQTEDKADESASVRREGLNTVLNVPSSANDADWLNGVAWEMVTDDKPRPEDTALAVKMAQSAVLATNRKNPVYLDTLAAALATDGQFTNAVRVQQEAIALLQNGAENNDFSYRLKLYQSNIPYLDHNSLAATATALAVQGKFAQAEPLARKCLALREVSIPDNWSTFSSRSLLGGCLLGQKKYAEAEPLLLSGYDGMNQREAAMPQAGRLCLQEALNRLVQLYEETGRPEMAADWKKKLAEFEKPAK